MSFLADVRQMAGELDEAMGTDIWITGALTSPNARAKADPARPRTRIPGIYHEPMAFVAGGKKKDGLKEVDIASTEPTVSIMPERLPWAVQQGDLVEIPEIGRMFRVMDIQREMHTRSRLVLEDLNRIPAR